MSERGKISFLEELRKYMQKHQRALNSSDQALSRHAALMHTMGRAEFEYSWI